MQETDRIDELEKRTGAMNVQERSGFLPGDVLLGLERLKVSGKQRVRGFTHGRRKSTKLGRSLDFADYRLYVPGDDIRQLDWNAYGRTGKPFVKLFMDEQELSVNLYVDASASMAFVSGDSTGSSKFLYARQLAACIGYISLSGYDRVAVKMFGGGEHTELPPLRGKGSVHRLFAFLAAAEASGAGDITALRRPVFLPRRPGISFLFSDFLFAEGVEETLTALLAARQEVVAVQVLAPEELNPPLTGDLRLIDSETGDGKEVAISVKVLKTYETAIREHTERLRKFCHERDMGYALAVTDAPLEHALAQLLRNGWLA